METGNLVMLLEEIENIATIEKCLACGCFYDTLLEFQEVLEKEGAEETLKHRLAKVVERIAVAYDCLGCEPCYTLPVANALAEIKETPAPCSCGPVCTPAPNAKEASSWPVEPGEYLVGNPQAPMAISTLGSGELPGALARNLGMDNLAIVGHTHTENIGLEKIIKNTLTNPHIRFLLLCGRDPKGHLPGQSLLALFHKGVNPKKRIVDSRGARPVLKNLEFSEIEHFKAQVEIIDLIGSQGVPHIGALVEACQQRNPGPYEKSLSIKPVPQIEAQPSKKLILDPAGFFILYPRKDEGRIYLEHYLADGTAHEVLVGEDPISIASTAVERGLISRLDHAAYLGRELEKAYLSMRYGFSYIQDKAPGEEDEKTCP